MDWVLRFNPLPAAEIATWLRRPENVRRHWLGRANFCVAWLGLLLAVLSPPHGSGVTVCWLKACIGLPCIGCGLTRSLSCGVRGMFVESWHYHPMGLLILSFFLANIAASLLPRLWKNRLAHYMKCRATVFNALYAAFVVTFVGFGATRAVVEFAHGHTGSATSTLTAPQ